jgi:ATP-binding cassette subfamily C protein
MRGLGMLQASVLRWQPRYDAALGSMEDMRRRSSSVEGIEELIFIIYECALKGYAAWLLFQHYGTVGLLILVAFFAVQITQPYSQLAKSWQAWAFSLQSWRRIQDALGDYAPPQPLPPDPSAPPGLVIEDASFHPAGRAKPIIGGLTLRLPPGTVVTVEGPNGVGKSTLLRLILGLMPPSTGRVLLDGQDTYHCERGDFGARIGYLPQDVQLIEGHVFHNIGRGPDAPADRVVAAARTAGAHDMIGRLPMGYQTPSGMTSGLSAGQRRLIGLARALYGDPRLLVLDEPEVGLDGYARVAMRTAVAAVRERGGVAVIVTHEPGTWQGAIDLRLVLSAGGGWQVQPADGSVDPSETRTELAALR